MKKEWENPVVTVLLLDSKDILCTSGGEDAGEWDG